jgi:hypothetical protein
MFGTLVYFNRERGMGIIITVDQQFNFNFAAADVTGDPQLLRPEETVAFDEGPRDGYGRTARNVRRY